MQQSVIEKQRKYLIRRFHILLCQAGIDNEGKLALLSSYKVGSSTELDIHDLIDLCARVERLVHSREAVHDQWRKRVMAAIGGWLKLIHRDQNAGIIRGIACRAAGYESFNDIPRERLVNIYNAFLNKQRDFRQVHEVTVEELEFLSGLN